MDDYTEDNENLLSDDEETETGTDALDRELQDYLDNAEFEKTMAESLPEETVQAEAAPIPAPVETVTLSGPAQRVFKIGSVRIPENDTTSGKTVDQVKALLKAAYPEVANATVREHTADGVQLVEFLPRPGTKG